MNFATLVPLPAGNSSRYTTPTRSLGGLQSRSRYFGEENILCLHQEKTPFPWSPSPHYNLVLEDKCSHSLLTLRKLPTETLRYQQQRLHSVECWKESQNELERVWKEANED
jgi:hypothetical protein